VLFTYKVTFIYRKKENILKKYIKFLLINTIIFIFTACDSSSYTITNEELIDNAPTNITINGLVIDGYISDATVCIDSNNDGSCSGELSSTTDENGIFKITQSNSKDNLLLTLLVEDGLNTSTNAALDEQLKRIVDTSLLENTEQLIVSPFTDLVSCSFLNSKNQDANALNDSKSIVAGILDIQTKELDEDLMQNVKLFLKTQLLQYTKIFIEKIITKNTLKSLSVSDKLNLQKNIKKYIIEFYPDTNRILISTAENQDPSIIVPDNEELFLVEQIKELKNSLNTLEENKLLTVAHLSRLEKLLHIKMQNIFSKLEDYTENNTSLEVVDLTITIEDLTQTIFNTTDAILDNQACVESPIYNILENTPFYPDSTDDATNGISVRLKVENGTTLENNTIKIFYPDLESIKTDDRITVFQENDEYYFVFDRAWVNNENNIVYVKSPKDENNLYSCYRYKLNSLTGTSIQSSKVFSYSEL